MSANVETMFYVDADGRYTPWHGMGLRVLEAPTSDDALVAAGLDWEVKQSPSFINVNGIDIPTGDLVNYRDTDNKVLGTVSERYKPVQNRDAFSFTDSIVGENCCYDTAGSLDGGKIVWLLARMDDMNVLGDVVEPYLLFANSHDGKGSVRVTMTNVRVVCQNTLNLALASARRSFSFIHKGDINSKIEEARLTIQGANEYNAAFVKEAEELAKKRISKEDAQRLLNILFPIKDKGVSQLQLDRIAQMQKNFVSMMYANDLANFNGTAWQIVNAASDYGYHAKPTRMTATYAESKMRSAMVGNPILDTAYAFVRECA